jgi:hypothetical protein
MRTAHNSSLNEYRIMADNHSTSHMSVHMLCHWLITIVRTDPVE